MKKILLDPRVYTLINAIIIAVYLKDYSAACFVMVGYECLIKIEDEHKT